MALMRLCMYSVAWYDVRSSVRVDDNLTPIMDMPRLPFDIDVERLEKLMVLI